MKIFKKLRGRKELEKPSYYFGDYIADYAKEKGIILTAEEIQRLTDWQGRRMGMEDPDPTEEEALQAVLDARAKAAVSAKKEENSASV